MISQCLSLAVLLTTLVTIQFSDVTFLEDGMKVKLGPLPFTISKVKPQYVTSSTIDFRVNSTDVYLNISEPATVYLTAHVRAFLLSSSAGVTAAVSGLLHIEKTPGEDCSTAASTIKQCNMTVEVAINLPGSNVELFRQSIAACDYVQAALDQMAAPIAAIPYPEPTASSTALASSAYFKKIVIGSTVGQLVKLPFKAEYVQKNVMRFNYYTILPISFGIDTRTMHIAEVTAAVMSVVSKVRQLLKIADSSDATELTFGLGSGQATISKEVVSNFFRDVAAGNATAFVQASIPAGVSLTYDLVVNDLRCNLLGVVCTIPVEGGMEVINSRSGRLGDVGAVVDRVLSSTIDSVLTATTVKATTTVNVKKNGRVYLVI